jgi:hypothetical protein
VSALACDRCGRSLLVFEDVRYEVVIRVTAAYDVMELDLDAVANADVGAELDRLKGAIEKKTAEELEAEIFKQFEFDLCGRCQREFLKDPLPRRQGGD